MKIFLALALTISVFAQSIPFPGPGNSHAAAGPSWTRIRETSAAGNMTLPMNCTGANFYYTEITSYDPGHAFTFTAIWDDGSPHNLTHSSTTRIGSSFSRKAIWEFGVTGSAAVTFQFAGGSFESVTAACYSGITSTANGESGCDNCAAASLTSTSGYLVLASVGTGTVGSLSVASPFTMIASTPTSGGVNEGDALAQKTASGGSDTATFSGFSGDGAVIILSFH